MLAVLCRRRRVRWFARELHAARQCRELSRHLWARAEACTPLHKVAQWRGGWEVCEFDGRRWRARPEVFDGELEAYTWCLGRCRERMTEDELRAAVAAMEG